MAMQCSAGKCLFQIVTLKEDASTLKKIKRTIFFTFGSNINNTVKVEVLTYPVVLGLVKNRKIVTQWVTCILKMDKTPFARTSEMSVCATSKLFEKWSSFVQ